MPSTSSTRSPVCSRLAWWLLAGLAAAPLASATNYNVSDAEQHDSWHSVALTLGEERHFRALEQTSYSDTILSVNYTAGVCDLPWLEMRVELEEHQPQSRVANLVPGDLRVDHETIHSGMAEFITQRGDRGFYVNFYLDELALLLDEMRGGETLRMRIDRGNEDYWFMSFELAGADAAISRAERLCEAAG
ncbi:hypothetical protein EKK97_00845 [Billgrantia tianxiuensis]|jgi:hypothetical protein|uniref:DUF695 domain-containing protein n=1 Tax=Billgrantia tianxiuensis TaxID=2497861 RepID=A0A6I6SCT8_9GAMM|nr:MULTISPECIES: hypothetical protein [Halomonas]MCE8035071.1 hypothetical protein [Halomonas sp. MCCC 1A11057]QHC48428.1 hypothetical protein EKK97_00845 [Halomonas tianxiuensis]